MSKKARRKYTVEDKIRILEEAREPNTTVSEVLLRHQVDPTTFYCTGPRSSRGIVPG